MNFVREGTMVSTFSSTCKSFSIAGAIALLVCGGRNALAQSGAPNPGVLEHEAVTPSDAIKAGADYLVVGRPITRAPDPRKAAEAIVEEIASALSERT